MHVPQTLIEDIGQYTRLVKKKKRELKVPRSSAAAAHLGFDRAGRYHVLKIRIGHHMAIVQRRPRSSAGIAGRRHASLCPFYK